MKYGEKLRRAFDLADEASCARILENHPELVDALASDGQPYLLSALHRESHGQPKGMSDIFIAHGARIDAHIASAMGDRDMVDTFIVEDENVVHATDRWQMRPLHWAAHCGHDEVAALLLRHGSDINASAESWTPLHLAVELGHRSTAGLLIERGADLNARLDNDHGNMTPIEMAREWEIDGMVEFLKPHYES